MIIVKTVYLKYVSRFVMYLGLLVLLIVKHFFLVDNAVLDTVLVVYCFVLMIFFVLISRNKADIEKNEDEMVGYVNAKVNSLMLNAAQIFLLLLICLLAAPYPFVQSIPIDRKTVSLLLISFLTATSLARIFLFRYYDGNEL